MSHRQFTSYVKLTKKYRNDCLALKTRRRRLRLGGAGFHHCREATINSGLLDRSDSFPSTERWFLRLPVLSPFKWEGQQRYKVDMSIRAWDSALTIQVRGRPGLLR